MQFQGGGGVKGEGSIEHKTQQTIEVNHKAREKGFNHAE